MSLFEQNLPDRAVDPYRDLLVLHVIVIEDHVDNGRPRGEFSHLLPIRSIAHAFVVRSACVDDTDQQCAQAKNKGNGH